MTANVVTGSGHVMANANYPSHHSESILGILTTRHVADVAAGQDHRIKATQRALPVRSVLVH